MQHTLDRAYKVHPFPFLSSWQLLAVKVGPWGFKSSPDFVHVFLFPP